MVPFVFGECLLGGALSQAVVMALSHSFTLRRTQRLSKYFRATEFKVVNHSIMAAAKAKAAMETAIMANDVEEVELLARKHPKLLREVRFDWRLHRRILTCLSRPSATMTWILWAWRASMACFRLCAFYGHCRVLCRLSVRLFPGHLSAWQRSKGTTMWFDSCFARTPACWIWLYVACLSFLVDF